MLKSRLIINLLSRILILESILMATSLSFSAYYGYSDFKAIALSSLITFSCGIFLFFVTRKTEYNASKREGYLIVTLGWIIISLFGTLPYILSGAIPDFTDAFFETMSGFTTTGASILTDIEKIPKGILFWRAMTHWIGGMGIIVLTVAIMPFLGVGGFQLFAAEVPGISKDKLHPRITETAKRLWGLYALFTLAETILLVLGGMNLHESLCHSFATMATGGFSTRNASAAAFSPYIQYVFIVFMFIAGINFTLSYLAVIKGDVKKLFKDDEFKFYSTFILLSAFVIVVVLAVLQHHGVEESFRNALFTVVSIITTTGFVNCNYENWGIFGMMLVFILMFIGGSSGSTGGSVKCIRHLLLIRNASLEFKRLVHPRAVLPVRYNQQSVSKDTISHVLAFFFLYVIIFIVSSLLMVAFGSDIETSMGSVAATLGNVGPGIGHVGPVENYAHLNIESKWLLSFDMLVGRLELFTVLIIFSKAFWKK
ncbi:MAG TPA: potassium transporter TrkG [Bacteroidia bacterium]|nr:potassium transporter TrkG [Bacteroidia bacterium]HRS57584.1 potassium transporter TrkG [Bacteroidia bacterium]